MVPLAPPRFSMTNCCPMFSEIFANTMRPETSVSPPAGQGVMTRTGFMGQVCASEIVTAAIDATTSRIVVVIGVRCLLFIAPLRCLFQLHARGPHDFAPLH